MASTYSFRDGCRVAPGTLGAYDAMNADFTSIFGVTLKISSANRSNAEQRAIFFSRYVRAADVRGRTVYDTRWFEGTLWYRISSAGTVAQPGTSNHENDCALDIRDTGSGAGVTSYGNARSLWIRNNATAYGFVANGYISFNEPWHIEYRGDPWSGSAPGITMEDDMTPEQAAQLDAVYKALFGPNNGPFSTTTPLSWRNISNDAQAVRYGILPILIHNQGLIAHQAGQLAAIGEVIEQLATRAGGVIDMREVEEAARRGTRRVLDEFPVPTEQ